MYHPMASRPYKKIAGFLFLSLSIFILLSIIDSDIMQ
jgi:hypothetical protein